MHLYIYIILLFTSFGRLDVVQVKGPVAEDGALMSIDVCMQEREDFIGNNGELVLAKAWKRIVTPCIEIQGQDLPRCE